jgi:hypothetical protein
MINGENDMTENKELTWWAKHRITTRGLSILLGWALYTSIAGYLANPKEVDLDIVFYTITSVVVLIIAIHFGINKGIEFIKAWKGVK